MIPGINTGGGGLSSETNQTAESGVMTGNRTFGQSVNGNPNAPFISQALNPGGINLTAGSGAIWVLGGLVVVGALFALKRGR